MQDQFSNPYSLQGRKANPNDQYMKDQDRLYRHRANQGYAHGKHQSPDSDEEPQRGHVPYNPESATVHNKAPTFYQQPSSGDIYNRANIREQCQRQIRNQAIQENRSVDTFQTLKQEQEWKRREINEERRPGDPDSRVRNWMGPRVEESQRDEQQVQKNRDYQSYVRGYYQFPSNPQDYPILPKPATDLYNDNRKQTQNDASEQEESVPPSPNYEPGQAQYREISANDIFSLGSNIKGLNDNANPNSINMNINNMYIINNSSGLDMKAFPNNPNAPRNNQANAPRNLGINQIRMDLKGATVTGQNQSYQVPQNQNINHKNGQRGNTGGVTLTSRKNSNIRKERKLIRGIRQGSNMGRVRSTHFDYEQKFEDIKDSGHGQGDQMQSQNKAKQRKQKQSQGRKRTVQRPKNSNTKFYSPINPKIESSNSLTQNQNKSTKQDLHHRFVGKQLKTKTDWKRDTKFNRSLPKSNQTPSLPVTPSTPKIKSKHNFRNQKKEPKKKTFGVQPKLYNNKNNTNSKTSSRKFKAKSLKKKSSQSPYKVYMSPSNVQESHTKPASKFVSREKKRSKNSFEDEKRISDIQRNKIQKLQKKFGGLDLEKLDMGNRVHKMNSNQIMQGKRDFNTTGELKFSAAKRQPKSHLASISVQYGPGLTSRGTRPVLYQSVFALNKYVGLMETILIIMNLNFRN